MVSDMYIDSFANRRLTTLRKVWRKREKSGVYLLIGPTGCGKTTFLNSIFNENTAITRYFGRDLSDMIIESVRTGKKIIPPACNVVFIESIDGVLYTDATMSEMFRLIKKWADEDNGRLIICTAECNSKLDHYKWVTQIEVKPLKVNKKAICALANNKNLALSRSQIRELRACRTMNELNERLNRILLINSI